MLKRKQPLALPKSSHSKSILFYYERPRGRGRPNLFLSVARATGSHVFIVNYATTPLTPGANLLLRFMHDFGGGDSFDYETANIPFLGVTSYIDGYTVKPIIGKELRLLCHPTQLPPGPYNMSVTYLLVR